MKTKTSGSVLESNLAEVGLSAPVIHDKGSFCHGRSNLLFFILLISLEPISKFNDVAPSSSNIIGPKLVVKEIKLFSFSYS